MTNALMLPKSKTLAHGSAVGCDALEGYLLHPVEYVSVAYAMQRIPWCDVTVAAERPRDFEEIPDLPDRVRGALGRALERSAALHPSTSWLARQPDTWTLLFGKPISLSRERAPRPFVVQTDVLRRAIAIRVRLIGLAAFRSREIADALKSALQLGIAIKNGARLRLPLKTQLVSEEWNVGLHSLPASNFVTLKCVTPLVLRRGDSISGSLSSLPMLIFRRFHGLARWAGMDIAMPSTPINREFTKCLRPPDDLQLVQWRRRSSNPTMRDTLVSGFLGKLVLEGNLEPLMPYFGIANAFHAGGQAALGFGRLEVICA